MDTERPRKSHLGGLGVAFAVLGVAVAFCMLTLIVLFGLFMSGDFSSPHELFGTLAALMMVAVIALVVLYARSGILR